MALDKVLIRCSEPSEVALYLKAASADLSAASLTQDLLAAIERGSITPFTFSIWLGVSRYDPSVISQALTQNISVQIRKYGIHAFRKTFGSSRWKETWEGLGGNTGLVAVCSEFSVIEVGTFCGAIGQSAKQDDCEEKREAVSTLLAALLPRFLSGIADVEETGPTTSDPRPLSKQYIKIVPACTSKIVTEVIEHAVKGDWKYVRKGCWLRNHADTIGKLALQATLANKEMEPKWLPDLLRQQPPSPSSQPKFSASMLFSFEVLKTLVGSGEAKLPKQTFIPGLVESLLRRAIKKKVPWIQTRQIVDLSIQYLNQHPEAAAVVNTRPKGLLYLVISSWSKKPELFEAPLRMLLVKLGKKSCFEDVAEVQFLSSGIKKSFRYSFLRIYCQEVAKVDIDDERDLAKLKYPFLYTVLEEMDARHAVGLLRRLQAARGDEDIISQGRSRFQWARMAIHRNAKGLDPNLMCLILGQQVLDTEEILTIASAKIEELKKKAKLSADSNDRVWNSQMAQAYAIASGRSDLLKDFLLWAQRFVRDPRAKEILVHDRMTLDLTELMCGVPEDLRARQYTPNELKERVKGGNEIFKVIFDTIRLLSQEPGFSIGQWEDRYNLFHDVMRLRMRRSSSLKSVLALEDNEVFDILWPNTLDLLIGVEKVGLSPGQEMLGLNKLGGILGVRHVWSYIELKDEQPSTYRFLDEFAKRRDSLWREHRPTVHPAAASMPEIFPTGLAIQDLIRPYVLNVPDLDKICPYIYSRAHAAVYPDPTKALEPIPDDEELREAYGYFIDDYIFALKLLSPSSLEKHEQEQRADDAWKHAVGALSESRMTPGEAERFWSNWAEQVDSTNLRSSFRPAGQILREWPVVPKVDDPCETEEWNPVPDALKDIPSKPLGGLTYIDLSRNISNDTSNSLTIRSTMKPFEPAVPEKEFNEPDIFDQSRNNKGSASPAVREGQILAALLYLDSSVSSKSRILANTPFPARDDVRFPCVYLEHKFLSKDMKTQWAIKTLQQHIKSVPPNLLAQVVEHAVHALDTSSSEEAHAGLQLTTFMLIKLLAKSDRPMLASRVAIETVLKRPKASAWHRQLIARGYFRRLSASDARACLATFADAIIERIDEQAQQDSVYNKPGSRKKDPSMPFPDPLIKVTTVKLLAQLLGDTDIVSEKFAVDLLTTLIQKASHVDIRRPVVDSLLTMLLVTSSVNLQKRIFSSLEDMIPIVANLNERCRLTDADWDVCAPDPPEIEYNFSFYDEQSRPMLGSFRNFLKNSLSKDSPHTGPFMSRIMLPILTRLQEGTTKWMSLFLRKHGVGRKIQNELALTYPPGGYELWQAVLQTHPEHVPVTVLEQLVQHIILNANPPAPIAELNKRFRDDSALLSQQAVRYWLATFGQGLDAIRAVAPSVLPPLFGVSPSKLDDTTAGVTTKRAQELYLNLFTVAVLRGHASNDDATYLATTLKPTTFTDPAWLEHKRPVVEAMVLYVESLRTKAWHADPNRSPRVLPDLYEQRLWLLKWPATLDVPPSTVSPAVAAEERDRRCKVFAEQVAKEVDGFAGRIYHGRLATLAEYLQGGYLSGVDKVVVALHLGDITRTRLSWITLQDQLRVELASKLIRGIGGKLLVERPAPRGEMVMLRGVMYTSYGPPGDEERDFDRDVEVLEEKVEGMITTWKMSENEEVRRIGYAALGASGPGGHDSDSYVY
ncbi:hypothetical protein BU24DRAFT_421976 [Aaosphaeria arxii CBS 175.79]|uniref:Uncharacterized protein n=1 Tax=Aaosphaeria arxii CBS 175.79 TaxID=1450172 RepID=A0A6A5XQW0_9PLEO|nr:uncharacterized protein BU24DRAFT_421976 [Aaosphaeria arxii CBS 175.79]KAF2015675.1 hypothetical protein BU24DRAFT_421976 [Aaosphaeria arxii CBS 175.79]